MYAQNTKLDYKFALKIYNQSSFEQRSHQAFEDTSNLNVRNVHTTWQYIHPTIAFQWKTKRQNFSEIELIDFSINKRTVSREQVDSAGQVKNVLGTADLKSYAISMRYEYTVMFKKLKQRDFVPSISFAVNSYFKLDQVIPGESNAFKTVQSAFGARGFVTPRLVYYTGSRLFLDFNIPICLMDMSYNVDQHENPSIPTDQQSKTNIDFELFPKVISVRLGVGVKI